MIYVTFPNKKTAKQISKKLVKEKLVACANIHSTDSVFIWKGKLEDTKEYIAVLKTKTKLINKIIKRIKELHPYECPSIEFMKIRANKDFLKWIDESTI